MKNIKQLEYINNQYNLLLREQLSKKFITLFHGTTKESAEMLMKTGWVPNSGRITANMGNRKYFYLTSDPEDALWFANEVGDETVLMVSNIPISGLYPDPDDSSGYSLEELLKSMYKHPSKFIVKTPISASQFSIYKSR